MKITRRTFLRTTLATGALFMGAGSVLSACSGVKRSDLDLPEGSFETVAGLDQQGAAILYYASLAPSSHNAQPWFVKVLEPGKWIVGIDPERRLVVVDPENREMLLSMGAFVENLSLAAGALGYEAHTEIIAREAMDQQVVAVSLVRSKPTGYPLERITSRRTVRGGFRTDELKGKDVRALSEPFDDRLFYYPRGTEHAQCIEEGVAEFFRAQTFRDEAQKELREWTRLSNAEAKKYRSGLTTEGMEITGIAGWYVRTFMKAEDVMKDNYRKRGIDRNTKWAAEGGGWFILTSTGRGVVDLVDTGRRFERMALMARERNVAVHPMTQYLEEEAGLDQISKNHEQSVKPQFILRVGYLDSYPNPVSLRRPVSWFVL
jgi:nitroreductase